MLFNIFFFVFNIFVFNLNLKSEILVSISFDLLLLIIINFICYKKEDLHTIIVYYESKRILNYNITGYKIFLWIVQFYLLNYTILFLN